MIWGEHGGYLNNFVQGFNELRNWANNKNDELLTYLRFGFDNFIPNLTPSSENLEHAAAEYIRGVFAMPSLALYRPFWGFKEVRYEANVALALQSWFPEARFIHLTRNVVDCFASLKRWELSGKWKREWTIQSLESWVRINRSFAEEGTKIARLLAVQYEDMVEESTKAIQLGRVASFLQLSTRSFDDTVFLRRLDGTDRYAPRVSLDATDVALLRSIPDCVRVAEQYGYTLE